RRGTLDATGAMGEVLMGQRDADDSRSGRLSHETVGGAGAIPSGIAISGMNSCIHDYLMWLAATNHSPATVANRRSCLRRLSTWCGGRGLTHPGELSAECLEAYRLALFHSRHSRSPASTDVGRPLTWGTQAEHLGAVRSFLRWCGTRGLAGPIGADLPLPRRPQQLPHVILSARDVEVVLRNVTRAGPLGLRDRAML